MPWTTSFEGDASLFAWVFFFGPLAILAGLKVHSSFCFSKSRWSLGLCERIFRAYDWALPTWYSCSNRSMPASSSFLGGAARLVGSSSWQDAGGSAGTAPGRAATEDASTCCSGFETCEPGPLDSDYEAEVPVGIWAMLLRFVE